MALTAFQGQSGSKAVLMHLNTVLLKGLPIQEHGRLKQSLLFVRVVNRCHVPHRTAQGSCSSSGTGAACWCGATAAVWPLEQHPPGLQGLQHAPFWHPQVMRLQALLGLGEQ